MSKKSDNSFLFLRFHFFSWKHQKSLVEAFCFEACICASVSGDKLDTISLRWPLDLLLISLPVSYTNVMLVRINKCRTKVTTVSFFLRFPFFHDFIFLSEFGTFKIKKVRSICLDLYLAFVLHFAVIRYTRIQSAYLLNLTRILHHGARPVRGNCNFVLSNSSLKTFQFLFFRIQGVCPNLIDLHK